jgi:cell division protein FtsB
MPHSTRGRRATGLRFDKVGRLAMLALVIALVGLYVRSGVSLWSAWNASRADSAKVLSLQAQSDQLKQQHSQLQQRWTTEAAARRLGMAHDGEKAYVIRGLPDN